MHQQAGPHLSSRLHLGPPGQRPGIVAGVGAPIGGFDRGVYTKNSRYSRRTLRFPDTREYSDHVFSHVDIPTEIIPDGIRRKTKDYTVPSLRGPIQTSTVPTEISFVTRISSEWLSPRIPFKTLGSQSLKSLVRKTRIDNNPGRSTPECGHSRRKRSEFFVG